MMAACSEEKEIPIEELWAAYQETRNPETREQLVLHYLSLVNIIVGRVAIGLPAHVERDDLISSGFFGLLDAIERYDPVRGNKFETYAGVRIRGAVLDYLRSKDWLPASLRQRIRKYEQTVSKLETKYGRAVTDEEITSTLGITINELNELLGQMHVGTMIPLEEYVQSESAQSSSMGPLESVEFKELQSSLAKAIDKLPEKERLVISLYYYEELTLKEISLILKLSEARISQLHTKAVFRMRGYLARMKANLF